MQCLLRVESQEIDVTCDQDTMVAVREIQMFLVGSSDEVRIGGSRDFVATAAMARGMFSSR